jgi:DNA invertase Pin-like site-specific DNA recombinase
VHRYFVYCRKSSEAEDRQMLSIESQRNELRRYAEREALTIVAAMEEAKSAKSPGRPVFNNLMKRVERGEADGILAWHPDRLARNALDGGTVIHFLDIGHLTDLKFPTYTFENTAQGKFMLAIAFGQSKYYVDSLSEHVLRGNRAKRERGWLPGRAPIGYLNGRSEAGEKIIVSDPNRFPLVQQLWNLLLSRGYSVTQLCDMAANEMTLRTPQGKRRGGYPLSLSGLYRVFCNPFYAGQIAHDGQWHPGKHEPMIGVAQFEQAQVILGRTTAARPKTHDFAYTGLMRCGRCGASVTAEEKVNRHGSHYVYYHCTHKKLSVECREKVVEERKLEEEIVSFLRGMHVDASELQQALAIIDEDRKKERDAGSMAKQAVSSALDASRRELANLTTMRYRDLIEDDEFVRERNKLLRQQAGLEDRLTKLNAEQWIEPSQRLFLFNNRAIFWLTHGGIKEKRLILATAGSNPTLMSKELNIDAHNPFLILRRSRTTCDMSGLVNDVRTFFLEHPEVTIPLLPEIPATHNSAP